MSKLRIPVSETDHITGNINTAKIVLVEYGDYECPHCGRAFPLVKKFAEENPEDVAFVFRNFPLSDSHEHALPAAMFAEAAGKQGKFWQMHDLIYTNQNILDENSLKQAVTDLQLDKTKFKEDFSSHEIKNKIEEDFEGGVRSGVNGTPSFFVNNEKWEDYDGTYESFLKLLS
ncbi:DsbA family protein [Epilithonimonas sp. UC225_85]|uniref:DsbA family protein n=1 Tax=Epilithonimonas sp. UC225_85 TaxID=3350167 RepID=UPI0036D3612E